MSQDKENILIYLETPGKYPNIYKTPGKYTQIYIK